MSIFDKILGKSSSVPLSVTTADKEEKAKKFVKKTEKVSVEKEAKVEKKPTVKKTKTVKTSKPKREVAKRKISKKDDNIAHQVLLENLISEKSTLLASQNKYVFKVAKDAGKFQIREAVEGYYGVQVVGVNTIRISPKKRIHGRTVGWKKGFKKAVVTLREGDTIGAVEGV